MKGIRKEVRVDRANKRRVIACLVVALLFLGLAGNFLPQIQAVPTGHDWIVEITTGGIGTSWRTFQVDVDDSGRVYLGSNKTVQRSDDGGETWTQIRSSTVTHDDLYVSEAGTVFLHYAGNVYYSRDQGSTWNTSTGWVEGGTLWHWDEDSDNSIYVNNYAATGVSDYIYKSADDGETWSVFYNVSASGNPVWHCHAVHVTPNDYVWLTTGDQHINETYNTVRRYNGTAWEILCQSDSSTDVDERFVAIWDDGDYVYFGPDYGDFPRMPITGTWSQRERLVIPDNGITFPDNEIFDALVVGEVMLGFCDNGAIIGSWDGVHWVLVGKPTTGQLQVSSRESFPAYFVDVQNDRLYRINQITKDDLIHLYYKVYNSLSNRATISNSDTYIIEQRVQNGTNYLDLTTVALSNVQANVKGLDAVNYAGQNSGWEWGNETGWAIADYGGITTVTTEDKYEGAYSMKVEKSTVDQTATAMRVDDFNIRKGDYLILEFCVKANMTVTNGLRVMMFNQSGGGLVLDKYWTPTTSWKKFSRVQRFTSESTWALRVVFYFQKTANWTCYFDAVMYRVPEVGIQRYVTGEAAVANGQNLNFTEAYFNDKQETINSTLIVNGETVSHSGILTNGTESSATSLTGILTGAVQVDANIQGSGQAILKITGTRVLYEDSIILKGRTSNVYYGRYYGTFLPTTTTSDLIAVTDLQANITMLTHSSNKLTLTIDSPSGTTSTTKVYCGDKGEPTSVVGATSWSYNNTSKILTTNVTHSSSINITVKWRFPGDVNDDGVVDASDLFDLSKAYGCKFGDPNWSPDCDFNGDNKVDASDLFDLNKNYGKTSQVL